MEPEVGEGDVMMGRAELLPCCLGLYGFGLGNAKSLVQIGLAYNLWNGNHKTHLIIVGPFDLRIAVPHVFCGCIYLPSYAGRYPFSDRQYIYVDDKQT